ncbi:hypothetical protein HYW41_01410 [Candidatus Daviesbacteria bacterium]|nr:hypothetical protein [Candidatus Daviesbacteria bacterium]
MNWKNNLILKRSLFVLIVTFSIFLFLASILLGLALYDEYKQYQNVASEKQEREQELQETLIKKELLRQEISPTRIRRAITYKLHNKPLFQDHIMIATQDSNSETEEPLFIGEERTGMPQWLDDEHILFTSYCGTACQGVYLINVRNKEAKLATLSFTFSDTNTWETHFSDWFGKKFQFPGLLGDIGTEFSNDNFYLVFRKKDQLDNDSGKRRLLFTGGTLIEQ